MILNQRIQHSNDWEEPWKRVKLMAVTKFHGIEDYYIQLREQRLEKPANINSASVSESTSISVMQNKPLEKPLDLPKPLELEENVDIKRNICRHILRSDYFDKLGEDWVDLDPRLAHRHLEHQKKGKRRSLREIFTKRNSFRVHFKRRSSQIEREYEYPLQKCLVSVGGEKVDEHVFECYTKKRNSSSEEIKRYLISEEYNVNAAYRNPTAVYITGRFVFEYNQEEDIVISALAEEPVEVLAEGATAELEYAKYKQGLQFPVEDHNAMLHPLRRLTPSQRIRLCATIFSSSPFEGHIKFFPVTSEKNKNGISEVNGSCIEKTVSFVDEDAKEEAPEKTYCEWTIVCKPSERISNNLSQTSNVIKSVYYVSRSHQFNKVFAHVSSPGKNKYLYADYYFDKTSVIQS